MANNFIQVAASAGHAVAYMISSIFKHIIDGHAVAYMISSIFKHIIDCVQLYSTNGFTIIVL